MKTWQKIKENPELLERYLVREKVIDTIRVFFKSQGFHEVSTPILVPVPSIEPNLEVFETELRTASGAKKRSFLIMSPEFSIKKLLAAGIGSCFEITQCFRNNEEISRLHNPEFTMLEWYRVGADYRKIMEDFEQLFTRIISNQVSHAPLDKFPYQGEIYDLSLPWPRLSVAEAFQKFCQIDTESLLSEKLIEIGQGRGYKISPDTTWEQMFNQFFFNEIEPKLKATKKPAIIFDYPASEASLSRPKKSDPRFAERFEIFLAGIELGNCFSELTDAAEQKNRFTDDRTARKSLGKTDYSIDEDLIDALKSGIPEVAGIAVGIDRLVMLAANVDSISDVLFFPGSELFSLEAK